MIIKNYAQLARLRQWPKQILIFLPLVSLGRSISLGNTLHVTIGAISFSLIASFVYVVNDILDKEADAKDNSKQNRPIASGRIGLGISVFFGITSLLLGLSLLIASADRWRGLLGIAATYIGINLLYSVLKLKKNRVLGITIVAVGFPLRFLFGTLILDLPVSYWAFALLMLLALAMLAGKRYQTVKRKEHIDSEADVENDKEFWLLSLIIFCAMFGAAYAGFISAGETQAIWGKTYLLVSTIPVALGLVRYLEIVTHPETFLDEDATESVLKDYATIVIALCYICIMILGRVTHG